MAAVVGALRADLSANVGGFASDMNKSAKIFKGFVDQVKSIGASMSIGLTAPLALWAVKTAQVSGDFEAAMKKVDVATGATTRQLERLQKQAEDFGRDKTFKATAIEAAQAMEALAKNGVSVSDILNGAAEATLTLAAATGGDYGKAADLATAVMQQFGATGAELPAIVDKISGALMVSKFGFDDYAQAIAQAGGVAGGLGLSFEDLNTAIAATSSLFGSGSDAGTSFKTFLTRLSPTSKEAAAMMKKLGIDFFDASGKMKPLADIAQMLKEKLGGLSDEAKNKALTTIFGTDAMRTAVGLMRQGAAGIELIKDVIGKTEAEKQMATLMEGLNGLVTQLKKSFESLMIKVGQSGFLEWAGKITSGLIGIMDAAGKLPKPVLAVGAAIGVMVAAIGPLLIVTSTLAGAIATLGPLWVGMGLAMSRLGPLVVMVTRSFAAQIVALRLYAATAGYATGSIRALGVAMGITAAVLAVFVLAFAGMVAYVNAAHQPSRQLIKDLEDAAEAVDLYREAVVAASLATGEARKSALELAAAKRVEAVATISATKAYLADQRAKLKQAEALRPVLADSWMRNQSVGPMGALTSGSGSQIANEWQAQKAQTNLTEGERKLKALEGQLQAADAALEEAKKGPGTLDIPTTNPDLSMGSEDKTKAIARATARYADQIKSMARTVAKGLDELVKPDTLVKVDELTQKIEDITAAAAESGVDVSAFADQIAALKARIDVLKTEGLAKEAREFGDAVAKTSRTVREYASGGLTGLERALQAVDDEYDNLKRRIEAQILANEVLAQSNTAAAESMAVLRAQLEALNDAHRVAADSARTLYAEEQKLAALKMAQDNVATRQAIEDARRNRGDFGPSTTSQDTLRRNQQKLDEQRMESERRLAELAMDRLEAEQKGETERVAQIDDQIALEKELQSIIVGTSAKQIEAANRLDVAFKDFTASLSDELTNMLATWKGDINGLKNIFAKLLTDMILRPQAEKAAAGIAGLIKGIFSGGGGGGASSGGATSGSSGGWLSSAFRGIAKAFSGGHAMGGSIPPGQWGVVGENGPEPAYGGASGMTVLPNSTMRKGGGGNDLALTVQVVGARGNREVKDMVAEGVAAGLSRYDQSLSSRVNVKRQRRT